MKLQLCIAAILLLVLQSKPGAQIIALKPLQINDTVPDVLLSMVYHTTPTARLHDFKDKLVLLDFWSTICSSCIHHIDELDSLQQLYRDEIFILPVSCVSTGDNEYAVTRFITGYRQRIKGGFAFPSAVNDSILDKLFPHRGLPDLVWIYKGAFVAETSQEALTAANIESVINAAAIAKTAQRSHTSSYDITTPLFTYTGIGGQNIFFNSLLIHRISGLESSSGLTRNNITGPKLYAINHTALALYRLAYAGAAYLYGNRIINETGNNDLFLMHNDSSLYCYELSAAGMSNRMMYKRMQQDLCAYFKIQGSMEKRSIQCLVLQADDTSLLHTSGGIEGNSLYENVQGERVMINEPLSALTERLNELFTLPVIDETGTHKNIDLKLPNKLTDIQALTRTLRDQGILLSTAYRETELLILSNVQE